MLQALYAVTLIQTLSCRLSCDDLLLIASLSALCLRQIDRNFGSRNCAHVASYLKTDSKAYSWMIHFASGLTAGFVFAYFILMLFVASQLDLSTDLLISKSLASYHLG